jgi:two-component SAPR family response regulator
MNGRDLAERMRRICPSAKVVFMSGYTDDTIARLDVVGHDLLRKPFTPDKLVKKVRAVLDASL